MVLPKPARNSPKNIMTMPNLLGAWRAWILCECGFVPLWQICPCSGAAWVKKSSSSKGSFEVRAAKLIRRLPTTDTTIPAKVPIMAILLGVFLCSKKSHLTQPIMVFFEPHWCKEWHKSKRFDSTRFHSWQKPSIPSVNQKLFQW